VGGKPVAEPVEQLERRRAGEALGVATDHDVVDEDAGDRGVVGVAVPRVRGQQHLFVEPEVQPLLGLPVGEERSRRLGGRGGRRAAKGSSDHEGVVVITRDPHEGRVALHRGAPPGGVPWPPIPGGEESDW
jgi:hypothetical protein